MRVRKTIKMHCLDTDLARVIAPALREYIAQNPTPPMAVYNGPIPFFELDEVGERCALDDMKLAWTCMLTHMVWTFETLAEGRTTTVEEDDRIEEGLTLFAKYYRGLWL